MTFFGTDAASASDALATTAGADARTIPATTLAAVRVQARVCALRCMEILFRIWGGAKAAALRAAPPRSSAGVAARRPPGDATVNGSSRGGDRGSPALSHVCHERNPGSSSSPSATVVVMSLFRRSPRPETVLADAIDRDAERPPT
ncbi:MAG: hypothetical protein K0S70_3672, partial [Microbacterium sp.]|nr:hypothetical protein [Microbacterium sp.]